MKIEDFSCISRTMVASFYSLLPEAYAVEDKTDLYKNEDQDGKKSILSLVDARMLYLLDRQRETAKKMYIAPTRKNVYVVDCLIQAPICVSTRDLEVCEKLLDDYRSGTTIFYTKQVLAEADTLVFLPDIPDDTRRQLILLDPVKQILSCRFLETIEI